MDFNKAKEVATSCLAMSTCGFILWTSQTHIQADTVNAQEQQVQQSQQTTKATTAEQFAAQTSATNEQQTDENYDQNDHGNYACLDSAKFNDQAQLTVSGWHATNAAQGRPYHYIIAYDSTNHREISRQNVTDQEVSRPDVQQVHNVYGASKSGFNVTFNLKQQLANLQNVQIISRYTNDQAGNGNTADYWFAPITIDRDNYGNLDGAKVVDQQLQLSGWNANNLNGNKPYHYIILLDRTINREVSRVLVKNQLQRLDVEKAYPQIENAAQSGFSVLLNAKNINFSHKLQALSRFSGSADGNSNYVDFYFAPITTGNYANQGHLDRFSLSDGQNLTISGWHANDVANFETNHFLILFDNTANRQVISQVVPTVQRTDVARAFPGIHQAGQSGFTTSFDLKNIRLTPGHSYSVVSRYSTSNAGNRFASCRGTYDWNGPGFKGDVAGSDKNIAFRLPSRPELDWVLVFEAPVDLMSYLTLRRQVTSNAIALCGLYEGALDTYLKDNPHIRRIALCLDADGPGQETAERLQAKYEGMGYTVNIQKPARGKDWNEYLQQRGRIKERRDARQSMTR